ncbi:hypothetical protein MATL_G00023340 [Megalops atlanticus]|uniref:Uncharacterized protein n=1 Tax=Megalops atlanticus TaxID=7932 RepID=A0A9D3QCW1_MEGAT|nr:hypothetical protein MATL_G00023340 [Megalops atlanticus]
MDAVVCFRECSKPRKPHVEKPEIKDPHYVDGEEAPHQTAAVPSPRLTGGRHTAADYEDEDEDLLTVSENNGTGILKLEGYASAGGEGPLTTEKVEITTELPAPPVTVNPSPSHSTTEQTTKTVPEEEMFQGDAPTRTLLIEKCFITD